MKKILMPALLLAMILLLSACGSSATPAPTLAPDVQDAVLQIIDPAADNLISSINTGDYSAFTRDMSAEMAQAMTEDGFNQIVSAFASKLGKCTDKTFSAATEDQGYKNVYYTLTCEKGAVTMRLVLEADEPYLISGLWFPDLK